MTSPTKYKTQFHFTETAFCKLVPWKFVPSFSHLQKEKRKTKEFYQEMYSQQEDTEKTLSCKWD